MTQNQPPAGQTGSFLSSPVGLILQAIMGLGLTAWMAYRVDGRFTRAWTPWEQGAWFVTMLFTLAMGSRAIIALLGGDTHFAWLPFILLSWLLVAAAVGAILQFAFALPFVSGFLGALAAAEAWWTWRLPWWFWEGWRAHRLRAAIGDRATRIVCGLVALVLAIAAVALARGQSRAA